MRPHLSFALFRLYNFSLWESFSRTESSTNDHHDNPGGNHMDLSVNSLFESAMADPCDMELTMLTLAEASEQIHRGLVTPTQLTVATLQKIAAQDARLNAYITVNGEYALSCAQQMDAEQKAGDLRGPLHGIPIALKDNIDAAGVPTTAASTVFRDQISQEDAEVTRRLKAAGAIIVGKLNLHEFAAGGTGHVSAFGATHNPWDLDRVTGGSSSGSGGAVAARLCFAALGTDTGGSIRIPSSWCGLVGLKPTYGLVSIRGIVPLIYSLDHCGPMVRTAEDAAIMLNVLAGYDPFDAASIDHPSEDYVAALEQPTHSFRLGAPEEFYAGLDPDVESAMAEATQVLSTLTAGVVSRDNLPPCGDFMHFLAETHCFHEKYFQEVPERYQPDTRNFLNSFAPVSAIEYIRARDQLTELRRVVDHAFNGFDLVILPTERILPFTIDEAISSSARAAQSGGIAPQQMITIANTYQFNMYGLPAVSIPCGYSGSGLPIGMTIAGPRFTEGKILALAAAFQKVTNWHQRCPPDFAS
jgi:aspartyl-tRNA(Asn)/glutamyl-tRNA(Gln) amidotransferase subunit A